MTLGFLETIFYMIWRGIAIGIIISAPMGPVGILCVQRTLEKGRRTGFFTGIGAAISDMIYCLLTGFGLSFIEDFLTRNHDILQLIGSLVLIGFGIYLFKSNPTRNLRKPEEGISDRRNILNGFLFTFSNPLIIFLIIGLFARFEFLVPEITVYHYIIGFISIGAGALLWWWVVTFFVAKLRSHFNLRSMWLINKIIGGIILIFALVGIVTAIKTMASAAERAPRPDEKQAIYLNSSRGFGTPADAASPHSPLVIESATTDTIYRMIGLPEGVGDFEFSFRAANLHNASGKSYRDAEGKKRRHPGWGIALKDKTGKMERILFSTNDNPRDETYSQTFISAVRLPEGEIRKIYDGLDLFSGENSILLSFKTGDIALFAGNREYRPIMSWDMNSRPDSIGFFVAPAARISIDHISIEWDGDNKIGEMSEFGNPDILKSYLLRSRDPMEGYWKLFDRSLEEDFLRIGGDYSFALIKEGDGGYALIYLSGARVDASRWTQGMIKARFTPTGFKNLYNVKWTDASGRPLPNEIKAEYDSGILTLTFPYESSSLRLGKVKKQSKTP